MTLTTSFVELLQPFALAMPLPDRLLRVVAVEPLRWSLEVAVHDSKGCLGFEQPQSWSRQAVERLVPVALWLYSLVVLWFVQEGQRHYQAAERPWYRQKVHPSFADMLATLKYQCLDQSFFARADPKQGCENETETRKILQQLLC